MTDGAREHKMSGFQRFFTTLLFPFAGSIERHSRSWQVTCPCGYSASVWERGGIRWLARGEPRVWAVCEECGARTWHRIHLARSPSQ